jgi:hypothetical protein
MQSGSAALPGTVARGSAFLPELARNILIHKKKDFGLLGRMTLIWKWAGSSVG